MKFSIAACFLIGQVAGRIGDSTIPDDETTRGLAPANCYVKQWDGRTVNGAWTIQNFCEPKQSCEQWEIDAGDTWEKCCDGHCVNDGLFFNKPDGGGSSPVASPVAAPTDVPTKQPTSAPTKGQVPTDAPTRQPTSAPTEGQVSPTSPPPPSGGACWKKTWQWLNDYCYPKPLAECAEWEIAEASTWEQCCEGHCIGTGLTKNKPGDGSPVAAPVPSPIASPVTSPVASPVTSPVASPVANPSPNGKCAATSGGECTFEPGAGISSWFTQELFDEMFPNLCAAGCEDACSMLTYPCLIQATLDYPAFANSGNRDDDKRELSAWLGIMGQETTGGGCQPPGLQNADGSCSCSGPSWCDNQPNGGCSRWGLCKVLEAGGTYCSPGGLYPCVPGNSYRGRGPKQLSWNYNYGQFSKEYCGDQNILLQNPDWVATNPKLAWASSMWFWFTGGACDAAGGERCKPSPHNVFTGKQERCPADIASNRQYGLGWATNIVNGGLECGSGSSVGKCDYRVYSRVRFYRHYCDILDVEPLAVGWTDDNNLFCGETLNYSQSPPGVC